MLARALSGALSLLARTWNLTVLGDEHVTRLRAQRIPVVFAVWHARMLLPLWHRKDEGITLLVSQHDDANYLALAGIRWGYHVVRGSSTRGAVSGLRGIVNALTSGRDAAFTPDGPRGPARRAKRGTLVAANLAGATIIPVGASASSAWYLSSWDQLAIPRPYARVKVVYGEPLEPGATELETLNSTLDQLEQVAAC